MVSARFCEELVALGLNKHLVITVIGEEPTPAYDRIKLSTYASHRSVEKLLLKRHSWYEEHGIQLLCGRPVEVISRKEHMVSLSGGFEVPYDALVLATGSRPFVPPIPGANLEQVFLYRTLQDLDAIIAVAEGKKSALVIGGGLLGLEAAQTLQTLGLETSVVERARFLMPQQLTETAGKLLREEVESQGIRCHLQVSNTRIEKASEGVLVKLDDGDPQTFDFVVISAGIAPNSQLAEPAGLVEGVRGGFVVDDQLATNDPHIFAIGECALLHGKIYGLAAPGYTMASHLAQRLTGKKQRSLAPLSPSTRLKMLGVSVVTIGDPLQEGHRLEYQKGGIYRTLIVGLKNKLVGALAVGEWSENGLVQDSYQRGKRLSAKQIESFLEEGSLFPDQKDDQVTDWAPERIVCNCTGVSKSAILECAKVCPNKPELVAQKTGASTVCGSCLPLVEQLCGVDPTQLTQARLPVALLSASALALIATIYIIVAPPVAMADSVESAWYQVDQLWRDNLLKQISGYSLMAVFLVGLIISLRKRFSWFTWGKFTSWRFFHSLFGVTSLGVLWAHTGFHFGSNLNFWLMFVFVLLNLLGAVAGIITALEAKGKWPLARRLRPVLTWAHLVLFWPLPVLLTFHILSVYLY